jgi:hypothetical protein
MPIQKIDDDTFRFVIYDRFRAIREADIPDNSLRDLVCRHRDNAGAAERLVQNPEKNARQYRESQNLHADIYQELLDRRLEARWPSRLPVLKVESEEQR